MELNPLRRHKSARLERDTIILGVAAYAVTAAALVAEYMRARRRGADPADTVAVALEGYRETPRRESALFNLLASFSLSFSMARGITYLLRRRERVGPFRNVRIARRHIHHFVPGILLAFAAGAAAILTDEEDIEPQLALAFGTGMGLTLDESALLLELDDVYWSREGVLSVQITLAAMSLFSATALALRVLRRGEAAVLEPAAP